MMYTGSTVTVKKSQGCRLSKRVLYTNTYLRRRKKISGNGDTIAILRDEGKTCNDFRSRNQYADELGRAVTTGHSNKLSHQPPGRQVV